MVGCLPLNRTMDELGVTSLPKEMGLTQSGVVGVLTLEDEDSDSLNDHFLSDSAGTKMSHTWPPTEAWTLENRGLVLPEIM